MNSAPSTDCTAFGSFFQGAGRDQLAELVQGQEVSRRGGIEVRRHPICRTIRLTLRKALAGYGILTSV